MKYYLITLCLIVVTLSVGVFMPIFTNAAEDSLQGLKIPQVKQQVAGVQKINLPPISKGVGLPILSARSVLVKDLSTDTILYQKQANYPVPIASTTKIMTALIGTQYYQSNSVLTVTKESYVDGSKVGLTAGETLSFRSLLYAMLLNSGNDAAYAIAENYPGGVPAFVTAMNLEAQKLNLRNTHFDNPAGFDSSYHYSSAADLSVITEEALKNPQLSRIFATKDTTVSSIDKKYTYQLHNLNKLLTSLNGVLGVKTGFTDLAKENLVTLVSRNDHKILTVVLGSDDRFGDSTSLIEWTYKDFIWQN